VLLAASLAGSTTAAWANGKPSLRVTVDVAREVTKLGPDGRAEVELASAKEVRSGDVLVYTLRYENLGDGDARRAVLSDPVPVGTVLIRDSVVGAGTEITFSIDGETYDQWPRIQRRNDAGEIEWVEAPAAAVKHIRWKLAQAVPPGGSGSAVFKVVVR
jgi:uncharacterized repeat protein (TIGR01451 family)